MWQGTCPLHFESANENIFIIILLEICGTECLNLCMLIQYIIKLSEAIVHMLHCTCIASSISSFLLLVVRGVPSLILAQSRVLAPNL